MADNRTIAQLLEAPTEGYEDAIVIPEITTNNFEIEHGLLNLVQNKQFLEMLKKTHVAHIRGGMGGQKQGLAGFVIGGIESVYKLGCGRE
ncbi:hypothetical protein Tco_0427564 [Tanacetum coccineum]